MKRNPRWTLPVVALIGGLVAGPLAGKAEAQAALPEGVTEAMVTAGQGLFNGAGLCSTCHAENGTGTAIGPKLDDTTWLHSDGAYPAILKTIKDGVPQPKESMIPMLPKGGSGITDEQAAQIAAYVWRLSHK